MFVCCLWLLLLLLGVCVFVFCCFILFCFCVCVVFFLWNVVIDCIHYPVVKINYVTCDPVL